MSKSELGKSNARLKLVHADEPPVRSARGHRAFASVSSVYAVRAVVILAGSVRSTTLRKRSRRSPLEMPVGANRTVLDCWREQLTGLADALGLDHLPVRVMVSEDCGLTSSVQRYGPVEISVEVDPSDFRGTAGLLSDVAKAYDDDDELLVIHGGQLLFDSLTQVTQTLRRGDALVSMATCPQGVPSGLMLVRCGGLRGVAPVGFVDLNEQALPELAKDHSVKIKRFDAVTTMSVRTLQGYIAALRTYHRRASGLKSVPGPYDEGWRPTFGIIEPGSKIEKTAVIHDSVVMAGARIEAGAVIVRSVVCPGAVVGRDQHIVDEVVAAQNLNALP